MSFSNQSEVNVSKRRPNDNQTVRHTLEKLRILSEGLTTSLGVNGLPLPKLDTLSQVKEFCSGLLINPTEHPWGDAFPSRRKRMSAAHSLFLFRKVIPQEVDPVQASIDYINKMSAPQEKTDSDLLDFTSSIIKKIFRSGWDRSYLDRCDNLTLSTKACIESTKAVGGGREKTGFTRLKQSGKKTEVLLSTRTSNVRKVAKGVAKMESSPSPVEVTTINAGGKYRTVTKASFYQAALSPLHSMIYDRISKEEWLLRGDADPKKFRDFSRVPGEVFVSGDYESATDNIKSDLYSHILDEIEKTTSHVPKSVFDYARTFNNATMFFSGKNKRKKRVTVTGTKRRGQLMGNFLSFPILCIINYVVFKYSVRRDVPVRINGDDIVFRSTRDEYKEWEKNVSRSGLTLSKGKTLVDDVFFSLNSSMFQSKKANVIGVPFVRSKPLFSNPETGHSLKGQFDSIVSSWNGRIRQIWEIIFLNRAGVQRTIRTCQRSLVRGIGLKVTARVLRMSGLFQWERYYSGLPTEPPLPTYGEEKDRICVPVPGFKSFRSRELTRRQRLKAPEVEKSFFFACRIHSKMQDFREISGVALAKEGTVPYFSLKKELRGPLQRLVKALYGKRKAYPDLVKVERRGASWMLPFIPKGKKETRGGLGLKHRDMPILDDV